MARSSGTSWKIFLKTNLLIIFIFLAILWMGILALRHPMSGTDVEIYYRYALNLMGGEVPYQDFSVEYPPLALLPIVVPAFINFGLRHQHSDRGYFILFLLQNGVLTVLTGLITFKIATLWKSSHSSWQVLKMYLLLTVSLLALVLQRYDAFPTLLTVTAVWALLINRPVLSGTALGFSIAAKIYPILLIPILGLYCLMKRQYLDALKFCTGCLVGLALVFLPSIPLHVNTLFSFLTYHKLRGLQIETIPAGLLLIAQKFKLIPLGVEYNYGAMHLKSPVATAILDWLPLIFLLIYSIALLACFKRFRWERKGSGTGYQSLLRLIFLVLLIFILANKVFSPQYLIWLIPFAVFLPIRQFSLFLSICILSTLIFPLMYQDLINMRPIPILLLNLRNFLALGLTLWLMVDAFQLPPFPKTSLAADSIDEQNPI
ncbi:MAG TPA: glycosyltransferase family 87 protein [Coleofasciculaceae cyanobacterium]